MQPLYRLTQLATPKTLGMLAIIVALLIVVPLGLKLNEQSQSTQSQAAPESAKVAGTSLNLKQHKFDCRIADPLNGIKPEQNCNQLGVSKIFAVDVWVSSDIDAANLVKTQLNFNSNDLIVTKIVTNDNSKDFIIKNWISSNFKNDLGIIELVGSVPDPGFTTTADEPGLMARIYFKVKSPGQTTISFDTSSSVYRSADNQNILNSTEDLSLDIN